MQQWYMDNDLYFIYHVTPGSTFTNFAKWGFCILVPKYLSINHFGLIYILDSERHTKLSKKIKTLDVNQ